MKWYWTQESLRDAIINMLPKYFAAFCKTYADEIFTLRINKNGTVSLILGDEDVD